MLDRGTYLGECFVVVHVDLFLLERAHETLSFGIIIRIAGAAHADLNLVFLKIKSHRARRLRVHNFLSTACRAFYRPPSMNDVPF